MMVLVSLYVPQVMNKPSNSSRTARDTNTTEEQENTTTMTTQCGDVTPDKLNISQTELYPHTDRFLIYPFLQPGPEYFRPADIPVSLYLPATSFLVVKSDSIH